MTVYVLVLVKNGKYLGVYRSRYAALKAADNYGKHKCAVLSESL